MEKVIITGADGFIGRHLIDGLLQKKCEIWAIVHPESSNKNIYSNTVGVHTIVTEIESLSRLTHEMPEKADAFYHLAWNGVRADLRNNLDAQLENIGISITALQCAKKCNVKKFIYPGSTSEYATYQGLINADAIPTPQSMYGSVKVALRYILQEYAEQLGIDFIYAVITGIYAADRRDNNVIFYTIEKLLKNEKPSLTKLEQKWDYIYIDDVVDALILIGEKGKNQAFYAIGHGDNQPLKKYIEEIHRLINPTIELGIGEIPYKSNLLPSSCVDLKKIQDDTEFAPKIDFSIGIKKVISVMTGDEIHV